MTNMNEQFRILLDTAEKQFMPLECGCCTETVYEEEEVLKLMKKVLELKNGVV